MAEHIECQELSEEQQLKDQLELICLDYQSLVNKSSEMAPKGTNSRKSDPTAENNVEDDDFEGKFVWCSLSTFKLPIFGYLLDTFCFFHFFHFQFTEIVNVANNLDSLESALNLIEERADRIREQLLQLLNSNREIRQSIQEENDKLRETEPKDDSDADSPTSPENNEPNKE